MQLLDCKHIRSHLTAQVVFEISCRCEQDTDKPLSGLSGMDGLLTRQTGILPAFLQYDMEEDAEIRVTVRGNGFFRSAYSNRVRNNPDKVRTPENSRH